MRKLCLVCFVVTMIFLAGCDDRTPIELRDAPRPVVIKAINENGVILVDGSGRIYTYHGTFYFSQILIASGAKDGDVLVGEGASNE